MNKKTKRIIVIAVAAVLLIATAVIIILVVNINSAGYRSISIADIFGKVMTQNGGKTYEAYKNMRLADGYALTTDPNSYTRMVLDDDKYVKLEQESHAVFEALGDAKKHLTTIRLEKGALTTEITKPLTETESYVVNTPNAVLAVRGTFFRVEVKQETNGDYYCDVYTYGGMVASHRIMPDGTHVDEEIVIPAGYKATIKMDEIITVYLEEKIEETADNIDPLYLSEVNDDNLVSMYNASRHGHEMFLPTEELWDEISDRGINLSEYKSVYDGTDIPPFNSGNTGNSDSASDNSVEKSESSSDISENTDSSSASNSSDQSGEPSDDNSSVSNSEKPFESSSIPSGSNDDNTHEPDPAPLPPQSSSASAPTSEPIPVESVPSTSINSVPVPGISDSSSSSTSSGTPVESKPSSSTDSESSDSSSDNTSDTPPEPPVHTHTPEETRVEPTCVNNGKITHRCSVCGKLLDETDIPAKGHTEISETTPATCTEGGKAVYFCGVCEIILRTVDIPAAGHTIETVTIPATCTENGKVTERCSVCNDTNETIIPATGHTFGEYRSNNNATCIKDGTKTALCTDCGERNTITDEGSILPHKPETVTVPSTCTEHGSETVICKACEIIITPKKELPLAEHTEVTKTTDPTCTEAGKTTVKCSTCGEEISSKTISPLGHSTETVTTPSTCTEQGEEKQICRRCNALLGSRKLPLAEHTEIIETIAATCTEDGKTVTSCEVCKAIIKETIINALGHDYEDKITKPASCTEEGAKVEVCTRCDEEKPDSTTVIEKLPHTEITEEADGISTVKCKICGEIITQTDLATGITYPIKISGIFFEPVPQSIADSDTNNDGKLSLGECRAVTELSFGEGETTGDILEQLVIFPALANINITVMITDGNLSIGSIGGLNDTNISNVTGGTYPSDVPGLIRDITAGAEVGCDFTMSDERTIPVRFVPAEGSTFAPETPEGVAINEENFPDEVFRQYVSENFDDNGDSYLSQDEIEAATRINVRGTDTSPRGDGGITSLKGIEYLTALDYLDCWYNANITEIDVSSNKLLTSLWLGGTSVTDIDVSNNTALKSLNCSSTQITSLDLSNNLALEDLLCPNQITSLDLTKNPALRSLCCDNAPITSLNLSKNTALASLNCNNTRISELDVSNNTALTYLDFSNTQIKDIDVSKNTDLVYLYCQNTPITSLDISKNTSLFALNFNNCGLAYIDISNNLDDISSTNFHVSGNSHLITVINGTFDTRTISGFNPRRISNLTGATMDANGVLSGITEGTNITYTYDCGQGKSATFTLVPDESSTFAPETPEITYPVPIDEEHFPDEVFRQHVRGYADWMSPYGELSQEECDMIDQILVYYGTSSTDKGIASLVGVEIFTKMNRLQCCYNSGLTELDVSKNAALIDLDCRNTQITLLDTGKNTALTYLLCDNTPIASLDLSNNTALTRLWCNNTPIISLDVSNNTALTDLQCNNCNLPFIDISNNANLTTFYANGNEYPIPYGDMFDVTTDLNFAGFDPTRVSKVRGADFSAESGIFDNFTSNTIKYTYDCKGTGESKYMVTFTLVRTAEATASLSNENNTFAVISNNGNDTTPPPSSADTGAAALPEDAALPPEDIEGLRFLPLGILALMRDRKRKKLYVKRKAEI